MSKKTSKLVYSTRPGAQRRKETPGRSLPPGEQTIRVRLERKGRGGKTVTVAAGFRLTPAALKSLAKTLKQDCGAGGTARGEIIEIQGDQRERVMAKLAALGYRVKRGGG